jgi:hypothetical protein
MGCLFSNLGLPTSCFPLCASNDDCDGRLCDLKTGACVDSAKTGNAPQTVCSVDAECRGGCGRLQQGPSVCYELCTIGAADACRKDPGWGFDVQCIPNNGSKEGDLSQCGRSCTCHAQCGNEKFACVAERFGMLYCGDGERTTNLPCPVR